MLKNLLSTIPSDVLKELNSLEYDLAEYDQRKDINSLLKKTVLMGGKRLRPMLTLLIGKLAGLNLSEVGLYAKVIEMVHAASLAHDDVVDAATTRRGVPSINALATNKKAVLAGDYLLADVIVRLSGTGRCDIVKEMSQIIQSLAYGEWLQLELIEDRKYTREKIKEVALNKTASVMSWCTMIPVLLKHSDKKLITDAKELGISLGMAFQMMDDTLDFRDSSMKDHFLDIENNIVNSVAYEWLELNPNAMYSFKKGEDLKDLWNDQHLDQALIAVQNEVKNYLERARTLIDSLAKALGPEQEQTKKAIMTLVDYMEQRTF